MRGFHAPWNQRKKMGDGKGILTGKMSVCASACDLSNLSRFNFSKDLLFS